MSVIPDSLRKQWDSIPAEPPEVSQSPPLQRRKPKSKRTTGDRFKLLNMFIDFTLRGLSRNEITVWMILYRDAKDGVSRTSIADLARRSGASTRNTQRAVANLKSKKLLHVVYRGGLRRGVSVYRVFPLATEPTR